MSYFKPIAVAAIAVMALSLATAGPASAKVEGDTIILGAAVSVTGKYSTNGKHTMNGYNLAVETMRPYGRAQPQSKFLGIELYLFEKEAPVSPNPPGRPTSSSEPRRTRDTDNAMEGSG